jgi:O-acetyl-ADP-ribose deacetylase (regulator of RNase III)
MKNIVAEMDLLDIIHIDANAVICHQVNCQNVMGSGIAKQIRKEFPRAYQAYMQKTDWKLGDCQIVRVTDYGWVANLAGQDNFGTETRHTEYSALRTALRTARDFAKANQLGLYLPHGIGCGLAGGSWEIVSDMIAEIAPDAIICKLP